MGIYSYDLNGQYEKGNLKFPLYNDDVMNNKIINILFTASNATTPLGTRWFEPSFGGDLEHFLFEPISDEVANNIRMVIYNNIGRWIDEIDLKFGDIDVVPDYDNSLYKIDLYWKNKNTNTLGQTSIKVHTNSNLTLVR